MSERNQNQALQAALAAADENMRQSSRKRKGLMAALIAGGGSKKCRSYNEQKRTKQEQKRTNREQKQRATGKPRTGAALPGLLFLQHGRRATRSPGGPPGASVAALIVKGWMHSVLAGTELIPYKSVNTDELIRKDLGVDWERAYREREEINNMWTVKVTQ